MKKIRINNSIRISWGITVNGNSVSLSEYKPTVKLIAFNLVYTVPNYTITGNVITFVFDGKSQEKCGLYTLLCQYTDSSGALHTIDSVKAFELVPHTCEEGGLDNSDLALEVVHLSTDIDSSTIGKAATVRVDSVETLDPNSSAYVKNAGSVNDAALVFGIPRGKDGLSAYEVAKNEGFSGTKEEWLESLKGKLNPVLDNLDKSELGLGSLPSSGGSLYYSGKAWEWKTGIDDQSLSSYLAKNSYATQSWVQTWVKSQGYSTGSSGDSGTTTNIDLTEYSWWGRTFKDSSGATEHTIKGPITVSGFMQEVTAIYFSDANFSINNKKLYLDTNGDLCFDGNFYATGGITALGSGGSGGSSGASLGTLLTAINAANPTPTASGQVLCYDGGTYLWKAVSSSTSSSVDWTDVQNKPSSFTPSSHSHSTSEISGLSSYIQNTKVNSATSADSATTATTATKLASARTIWGQGFDGTGDVSGDMSGVGTISLSGSVNWASGTSLGSTSYEIYGSSEQKTPFIDFHYYTGTELDYTARLIADGENQLSLSTNSGAGTFNLNGNKLQVGNGTLEWDSTNNCFKINGSIYATGGITALGVSNSSTTTNNVDFTFGSVKTSTVTADTVTVNDRIYLSDTLYLYKSSPDVDLCSNDDEEHYFYWDGEAETYFVSTKGNAFFEKLQCNSLDFNGVTNFRVSAGDANSFTIMFDYNNRTYSFTPSNENVTVS